MSVISPPLDRWDYNSHAGQAVGLYLSFEYIKYVQIGTVKSSVDVIP